VLINYHIIYFSICQQACSFSKVRTFFAEETKQGDWTPSLCRDYRCYATVEDYNQPPSSTVTLVIHSCYCSKLLPAL